MSEITSFGYNNKGIFEESVFQREKFDTQNAWLIQFMIFVTLT